jgi:glycosyltransferase involved in cell wall biosynthesis
VAVTDSPVVSAIIIFLDGERFLDEAIRSVQAQSFRAWELLLVDDGSSDGSTRIARNWSEAEPGRIRYLEHPEHRNLGMSAARNLGIAHARGEFLAFLDADDAWFPAKLEEQVALLRASPTAGMVFGSTEYWYSWTGQGADAGRDVVRRPKQPPGTLFTPPDPLVGFLHGTTLMPGPGNILVRTALARQVGGFEAPFRTLYEDQAFYAKICLAASVLVGGGPWDRYRQHPESACASATDADLAAARERFLGWLEGYLGSVAGDVSRIRRAIALERWFLRYPGVYRRLATLYRHIRKVRRLVAGL